MQLIIQSYLKTFLKYWVSTLGTLLFIIMLSCVVLGLMSTPLQLQVRTQWARSHSTSYDWEIDDTGINFSESFAFDYFVLDGYAYTAPIDDSSSEYLLNPWKKEAQIIKPDDLKDFLNQIKNGTISDATLNNILLTPSFYLFVDSWANEAVPDTFLIDFAKLMTQAVNWSNYSATTTFTYRNYDNSTVTAKYFVSDLDNNVKLKLNDTDFWFNSAQQLYLYNSFLVANNLDTIANIQDWNVDEVITKLNKTEITGLAIQIFNPEFRKIIVNNYQNNVESYLVSNALTTAANPFASENGKSRYEIQTKLTYTLSEVIPGNFTPSFSTDVGAIGNKESFNQVLIDYGREPVYDPSDGSPPGLREIVVSPSFLKKNKLRIGSTLTLPKASFAENIVRDDLESQEVAGTRINNTNVFVIVGTGIAYDELTPGSAYWNFVQPLKDYTYSYLPNNYINLYQKAAFLYGGSVKNNPVRIVDKVKNIMGKQNPYNALMWPKRDDYGMFKDPTNLVTPFSKLATIASLNTIKIQLIIYITLGLVSLLLAFVFINFIIKKEINETRRQLGIFKSFGYGIGELSLIFATKTLITIAIGIIVGWLCSIPLQFFMAKNFTNSVMFTYQRLYVSPVLLVTLFVLIPLLFTLVSYLLTLSYLREPALLLISNRQKMPLHKPHNGLISRTLEKQNKGFKYRLSGSFVKTSIGKFVTVQILFGFSALLYTLIFGARTVMYQVINQGFDQINSKTDHEYSWSNRNGLTINSSTNNQYTLQNIDNWSKDKINYINYKGYDSPVAAMNDPNNPAINQHLNSARYAFRAFFDALSDSVVQNPPLINNLSPTTTSLENWWLMPESIALERYAIGHNWNPDILNRDYYLYKVLLFKGTGYKNTPLEKVVEEMQKTNQPYKNPDNVKSPDFAESWIDYSWISNPIQLLEDLKKTFLGIISEDSNNLTNNFFLTDLSRLFSMVLAENYISTQLQIKMKASGTAPDSSGRYPSAVVSGALAEVYRESYSARGKLAKFDPRKSIYWGFTEKNPLLNKQNKNKLVGMPQATEENDFDLSNIFKNLTGLSFNLLAVAMISQEAKSMLNEPVINFNNLFYNSDQEQLQLELEMVPDNKDWGRTSILLSDFNKDSAFGSPGNVYNFAGITSAQWAQMLIKPGAIDEPLFNGILPYAIAQLYDVKVGDTVQLTTKTPTSVPIKVKVIGINKSVTLPLSIAWQINVDYNIFARTMFTSELQQVLGIGQSQPLSSYYFSGILSHKPMADGRIDVMGISESLNTIRFVGNQLTVSLAQNKLLYSSFWQTILDYLLAVIDKNSNIPEDTKQKIRDLAKNISKEFTDPQARMVTNPMVLNSEEDSNLIVSIPYNLARIGVQDFANTMNQLMFIFLLLQSILLTITLIVVMNIVIDEAAVIILTLRALGYSHNEINWIIMGPYVFWVIISFIIAYAISLIAWRILLTYARNRWNLIIYFRFNILDLVVPFCVLAFIMLIGWLASDYIVNRRPLTQITDSA